MPVSEAKKLGVQSALFHLSSRERMEKAARRMNRVSEFEDSRQAAIEIQEFKRQLREQLTGSGELELTPEELRRADQVRHRE
jgi:hypothetical protein